MIRKGQIYVSARPTFVQNGQPVHTYIKVVTDPRDYGLYGGKVFVVTLQDGKELRQRAINVHSLHASSTTKDGEPRRNGYYLVSEPED